MAVCNIKFDLCRRFYLQKNSFSLGCIASQAFSSHSPKRKFRAFQSRGIPRGRILWRDLRNLTTQAFDEISYDGESSGSEIIHKRKVVEHVVLFKAKMDLADYEEKDMLDSLYTSQYHTSGIVAISLGRIEDENADGFTHAIFMRFRKKEDLLSFYGNSFYSDVLKEHVLPYCHGLICVDFESEVEDDILPIFRRGEDFNYGVEFVLMISVIDSAFGKPVDDALAMLKDIIAKSDSLIVQATEGSNFNLEHREYTHGAVIRFPTLDALEAFKGSYYYKNIWREKLQPIIKKSLEVYFCVDPVGNVIM